MRRSTPAIDLATVAQISREAPVASEAIATTAIVRAINGAGAKRVVSRFAAERLVMQALDSDGETAEGETPWATTATLRV